MSYMQKHAQEASFSAPSEEPEPRVERPLQVSTGQGFAWREQAAVKFVLAEDGIQLCLMANNKDDFPEESCHGGLVTSELTETVSPSGEYIDLGKQYAIRWIMQEVVTEQGKTTLTLQSLRVNYGREPPSLVKSERPSISLSCCFSQFFERTSMYCDRWNMPPLCLEGYEEDMYIWWSDGRDCMVSRDAFSIRFDCPEDPGRVFVFTYALHDGRLIPCRGNGFERMVYAVLVPYELGAINDRNVQVDVMGMCVHE